MKFAKRWTIGLALAAAAAGTAFAGEDSTERWQGFGPAYWEFDCGHVCFSVATSRQIGAATQP